MKKYLLIILAFVLLGAYQTQAQVITGFGSAALNPVTLSTDFQAPWTSTLASQTASTLTVSAEPAIGGGEIYSTLTTPVALYDTNLSTLKLVLTGDITATTAANGFQIILYDNSGDFNSLTFNYNWGSFGAVGNTASVASGIPVESGLFNGTVTSWALKVGGGPSDTISFQFDTLTAVPEPSTYAMFGFGLLLLYGIHRRKVCRA